MGREQKNDQTDIGKVVMKTSIVLPIYQFNDELFKLSRAMLLSLDETEVPEGDETETIIVDNGSPIGADYLERNADVYIRNDENRGYCKAVNQGFKVAKSELLVVGNNDIRVSPNWLQVAKEILNDNPKAGSVHFKMVDYDADFNLGNDIWVGGKERWCHSSFYVIRQEALPKGLYFEGYKEGGFDDYDFWMRVRTNGWRQTYTNKAAFQHNDSSTYRALDARDKNRAERDFKNRELYKERFGEYPDEQFARLFPEQMLLPWKPFI